MSSNELFELLKTKLDDLFNLTDKKSLCDFGYKIYSLKEKYKEDLNALNVLEAIKCSISNSHGYKLNIDNPEENLKNTIDYKNIEDFINQCKNDNLFNDIKDIIKNKK